MHINDNYCNCSYYHVIDSHDYLQVHAQLLTFFPSKICFVHRTGLSRWVVAVRRVTEPVCCDWTRKLTLYSHLQIWNYTNSWPTIGVINLTKNVRKYVTVRSLSPSNLLPHRVTGVFGFFGLAVIPKFDGFWWVPEVRKCSLKIIELFNQRWTRSVEIVTWWCQ